MLSILAFALSSNLHRISALPLSSPSVAAPPPVRWPRSAGCWALDAGMPAAGRRGLEEYQVLFRYEIFLILLQ